MLIADAGSDITYCEGNGPAMFIGSGNGVNSYWSDIFDNILTNLPARLYTLTAVIAASALTVTLPQVGLG